MGKQIPTAPPRHTTLRAFRCRHALVLDPHHVLPAKVTISFRVGDRASRLKQLYPTNLSPLFVGYGTHRVVRFFLLSLLQGRY